MATAATVTITARKHDGDEPGGSICCFWRGLRDTKGVNENIGEIEKRLHSFSIKAASSVSGSASIAKVRLLRMESVLAAVVAGDYTN